MTHFKAMNRHGKLSVLGRVNPAAAPTAMLQPKGFFFYPVGLNRQVAQEFYLKTRSYKSKLALPPQIIWSECHSVGESRRAHYMEGNNYF